MRGEKKGRIIEGNVLGSRSRVRENKRRAREREGELSCKSLRAEEKSRTSKHSVMECVADAPTDSGKSGAVFCGGRRMEITAWILTLHRVPDLNREIHGER